MQPALRHKPDFARRPCLIQIVHLLAPGDSIARIQETLTRTFSADDRAPDPVVGARSQLNFQCQTSRFYRESGRLRYKHHLDPRHVAPACSAQHGIRLGSNSRFRVTPPSEFWPGATQFNEKECCAYARPDHSQVAPRVIGEQLEGINASENKGNPFCHDPEKQLDTWIDGGESNEYSKVQSRRTGEG